MVVKITNTLGDLSGAILENAATEETLQELLKVMEDQAKPGATRGPLATLEKSSKDASKLLDQFGREIESNTKKVEDNSKSQEQSNKLRRTAVASLDAFNRGLKQIHGSTETASGSLRFAGSAIGGTLQGLGQSATVAGSGLSQMSGIVGTLGGALSRMGPIVGIVGQAFVGAFAVLSGVVGMAQGFQDTFVKINDSGFVLDSQFSRLVDRTIAANLTLGQFAGVVNRNRLEFARFSGSVTDGANRLLDLRTAMSDDLVDGFINMGVQLEHIPDHLANYLSLLGRSGRQMAQNDQMAIEGATRLFQQQRLLANLTGQSVDAIRAEAMERTRATRVQASFNEMVPGARDAYAAAAGAVQGVLGPQLAKGFEAIFAGDIADPMYQAIMGAAPGLTAELESLREGIASGAITPEEAQRITLEKLQAAGPMIEQELNTAAEFARYSIETPFHKFTDDLGFALDRLRSIQDISFSEAEDFLTRQFEGRPGIDQEADPMLASFQNIIQGTQEINLAMQQAASAITETLGSTATGVFAKLADGARSASDALVNAARTIDGLFDRSTPRDTDNPRDQFEEYFGIPGYSKGGIINAPASGELAMLHNIEAVVPLPDGRSIPVDFQSLPDDSSNNKNLHQQTTFVVDSLQNATDRLVNALSLKTQTQSFVGNKTSSDSVEKTTFVVDSLQNATDRLVNALSLKTQTQSFVGNETSSDSVEQTTFVVDSLQNATDRLVNALSLRTQTQSFVGNETSADYTQQAIPVNADSFSNPIVNAIETMQINNNSSDTTDMPWESMEHTAASVDELNSRLSAAVNTGAIIDNSRSMPDLVRLTRDLLSQNHRLNENIETLLRATVDSNTIARNSAYARA